MIAKLPPWFKQKPPSPESMANMKRLLDSSRLHTICESARCPNIGECFSRGTATFLILGDVCTRNCTFCAVRKGSPHGLDENEPEHLLEAVRNLKLRYAVITSVTRDDLPDGGALQFAETIKMLRSNLHGIIVEVLVPDFKGSIASLNVVIKALPHVIAHNLETVPRLYAEVRPGADYRTSLGLLSAIKKLNPEIYTKSGLMLGLGETKDEVAAVMDDLREVNCDILTIGQYLQPSSGHHPVVRFIPSEEFFELERKGMEIGFPAVVSAPLIRSSFKAAELYATAKNFQP